MKSALNTITPSVIYSCDRELDLRVFKNAWFARFAQKEQLPNQQLWAAIQAAERGLIDADLGSGVVKLRIARPGGGKSKGYRTIVMYQQGSKAFFVFGFAKNELANIRDDEVAQFKKAAKHVLSMSDAHIRQLINNGQLEEVEHDDKKISH